MNDQRRGPRRVLTPIFTVVMVVALAVGGVAIYRGVRHKSTSSCRVDVHDTPPDVVTLSTDQAENATTIAAVAKRLGLADHAVTIGLAAALQESKLQNLGHGDRDSLGLFQQRPSQGWGTPQQVMDPAYAANAFFTHLARVANWENLPVTTAAQEVQRSGAPDAYAGWEPEARVIARALTGETPAGLACSTPSSRPPTIDASLTTTMTRELGPVTFGAPVATHRGWTIASWLVTHARRFGISAVELDGYRWTPGSGHWSKVTPAVSQVSVERYSTT
ncbi:MAG TPA: hypothetical protein VH914_08510 [Acidimicrobiia bacterium]|nr:hypothetical protein [Acidimicrobiia bacterium]